MLKKIVSSNFYDVILFFTLMIFTRLYILVSLQKLIINKFQVVYVTALLPYLLLGILLINGLTLNGSYNGIWYFIKPRFDKLSEMTVTLEHYIVYFTL